MKAKITFANAYTVLGHGSALWRSLTHGECGLLPASDIFGENCPAPEALVGCFRLGGPESPRLSWILDRMHEAFLAESELDTCDLLIVATNFGDLRPESGMAVQEVFQRFLDEKFPKRLARRFITICDACSSGTDALGLAALNIRQGAARKVGVLAADSFDHAKFLQHVALGTQSRDRARPFDSAHSGTSFGEGGAFIILAAAPDDLPVRGAELSGFGVSSDAGDLTAPDSSGEFPSLAASRALAMATCSPTAIDLIKVHGSGTLLNDFAEDAALRRIFIPIANTPSAFGTKGAIGHLLGATGLVEAVITCWALRDKLVPPTVGNSEPQTSCAVAVASGLRTLQHSSRRVALASTYGFGGINSSVVIKFQDDDAN